MLLLKQVPDASISVEAPSLDVNKPKKSFGFSGMFKKPSVEAGLKVSLWFVSREPSAYCVDSAQRLSRDA